MAALPKPDTLVNKLQNNVMGIKIKYWNLERNEIRGLTQHWMVIEFICLRSINWDKPLSLQFGNFHKQNSAIIKFYHTITKTQSKQNWATASGFQSSCITSYCTTYQNIHN